MTLKQILILLLLASVLLSCFAEKEKDYVVIGIPSDITTLNPLYSFSGEENNITELMFLSLLKSNWNFEKGSIEYKPMLAKSWKWTDENSSVIIELRDDVFWSDGVKCTIDDVIFSFDIYSDPIVKSRALGYFENFYTEENGKINVAKSFEKLDSNKLKINFRNNSNPTFIDIDHPILPKHYFNRFDRDKLATINVTKLLVTNGAYQLDKWNREQVVVLKKNEKSFLINKNSVPKIIFKVIPEYQMRLNQLTHGEIDLMEDIKADDIKELKHNLSLNVVPISGRDFDYIGWNNISPKGYSNSQIIPNKLFGSARVRKALTYALNRNIVIEEYLYGYGQLASTSVSPIFSSVYDKSIIPFVYNPELAKDILQEEGWYDSNKNGIIDKDGVEFTFTLHIPSGNPRREFAASLFQNNLKSIGVDMIIESNEISSFIDNLFSKKFDAWMAAWVVPIPINLSVSWYSDLSQTPLNFVSYQNEELDILFDELDDSNQTEKILIYKRIQDILYKEQPSTFLYWIDNIVCYNKKIKNIKIDPLGAVRYCWGWKLEQ